MPTKLFESLAPGDVLVRKLRGTPTLTTTARVVLARTRPLLIREHRMEYKNVEEPIFDDSEVVVYEKLERITRDLIDGYPYHKTRVLYHFDGFICTQESIRNIFEHKHQYFLVKGES